MLWYKQSQNKNLILLGYLVGDSGTPEAEFKNKVQISGRANKFYGSLNLTDLGLDSEGVYFCAAYPQQ